MAALTFSRFFLGPFQFIPSSFSFNFILSLIQSLIPGICVARMPWWWSWKAFSPPACSILSALARRLNRCLPPVRVMTRYGTDHKLQHQQSPRFDSMLRTVFSASFYFEWENFSPRNANASNNERLLRMACFDFISQSLLSLVINNIGIFGWSISVQLRQQGHCFTRHNITRLHSCSLAKIHFSTTYLCEMIHAIIYALGVKHNATICIHICICLMLQISLSMSGLLGIKPEVNMT